MRRGDREAVRVMSRRLFVVSGVAALTAGLTGCGRSDLIGAVRSADADPVPGPRVIDRLTIHHTASGATSGDRVVDVDLVASWHRRRGLGLGYEDHRACAYHYLILPDGRIQAGRPLEDMSTGTRSAEDDHHTVAVCLVGDFESTDNPVQRGKALRYPGWPTRAQRRALEGLASRTMREHGLGSGRVRGHREVSASDRPGDRIDLDVLRRQLRAAQKASGARS